MREKEFYYPSSKTPVKFNYFDYIEDFNKVLLYKNDKKTHSWFIKMSAENFGKEIPNWFIQWWFIFGTTSQILPENFMAFYTQWWTISPKASEGYSVKGNMNSLNFFMEFSIPWIWKWEPEVGKTDEGDIPCLKRDRKSTRLNSSHAQ